VRKKRQNSRTFFCAPRLEERKCPKHKKNFSEKFSLEKTVWKKANKIFTGKNIA